MNSLAGNIKKRTAAIFVVGCAISALISPSSYAMPLTKALEIAYENNPSLKAERETLKALNESMPQAYAGFMPNISGSYSKGRELSDTASAGRQYSSPETMGVTINQPLFRGGQTYYSIKQADKRIMSGRERLRQVEQEVMVSAITAYVDVVRTREVLQLSKNNERVLAEQLEATKDRFELGETTRTDVAQSESRLARAESDRINAEGDLIAAISEYKRIFGVDPAKSMSLPRTLPKIPPNFKKSLDAALESNPSLLTARYNFDAAKYNIETARAVLLPSVSLVGRADKSNSLSSIRGRHSETQSVTVNVTVPIYQSGTEYSQVRQAKRNKASSHHRLDEAEDAVIDTVTKAWRDIQTSRANIKATASSVKAAEVALEGVKQEQEVGSRTTLDVLDAEQELFVSRVNLVTARRNGVLSVYNLKSAMGELDARSLGLDVEYYDPVKDYQDVKYQFIGY